LLGCRFTEIGDPVVVGACQRIGNVRITHEKEALGEPGRVKQRLIDPHRVHVGETSMRIRGTLGGRMFDVGSKAPIASQSLPGRQSAWRGRLGLLLSRNISPLTAGLKTLVHEGPARVFESEQDCARAAGPLLAT